ncbi:glycoside hydrolase family 32 protein [Actinomyces sp. MRS3W]|uniref:glycoside hydrolase family 32 protein n=1 Tax=Actinomyces sp. MRS3W TaxID=2800796 RepID=UPI0028FD7BF1|nr:glycoside hydrolase family 32 protein [Actinomyces sp. MRS3W]MDU0348300.1 glycoside hydrolase family 32 protein [Actinomyces sp. MRS3W]
MAPRISRPHIHFTAHSGWINDPHGLSVVDGRYHLFFQHVPGSTVWQPNCHWGHAVSDNLVDWEQQPIALAPGGGDDGVWSGSMTRDDQGEALAFYTSVQVPDFGIGRVRVARPADSTWTRWEKGDVVVELPPELDAVAFRDPFVFRDDSGWRMLVGTSLQGNIAAATSFSSPDRVNWTYDGIAASRPSSTTDPVWTGSLWECPQLFEVDGQHILVTSVWEDDVLHYVVYATGDYEDGQFCAHQWQRLTYGDSYYAPSFFRDRDGQPCLIFWLRGAVDEETGWAGAHSVPYRLSVVGGRLVTQLHPEVLNYMETLTPSQSGHEPALFHWRPTDGDVQVLSGSVPVATLHRTDSGIEITAKAGPMLLPNVGETTASLLLDGPILELCCGTLNFALTAAADLSIAGGGSSASDPAA